MSKFVKSSLLILGALLLVAIAAGCSRGFVSPETGEAYLPSSGSSHEPTNGLVQSSVGDAVTIDVEWIKEGDGLLIFDVSMNTHSVDLDGYDLRELAVLRDDTGNEYHPVSWDSAAGGHHRGGTLTFPIPDSVSQAKAKYIEMMIRDVAGIEERVLKWEL